MGFHFQARVGTLTCLVGPACLPVPLPLPITPQNKGRTGAFRRLFIFSSDVSKRIPIAAWHLSFFHSLFLHTPLGCLELGPRHFGARYKKLDDLFFLGPGFCWTQLRVAV